MKDNSNDSPVTNGSGNPVLPLYDFFITLKQNNFSISPRQIADCNRLINGYSHQVKNEEELCAYLSAVVANTKEEQVQFKELFDSFYKQELPSPSPPPLTWKDRLLQHIKKNIGWWMSVWMAVLTVAVILYCINKIPPAPVFGIEVYQADSVSSGRADVVLMSSDTLSRFTLSTVYDWGDNSKADSLPWHYYQANGSYGVKATVTFFYQNKLVDTATVFDSINICMQRPQLQIRDTTQGKEIQVGSLIQFTADVHSDNENDITWTASGDTVEKTGTGRGFAVTFNNTGTHTIFCRFSPAGSFCTAEDRVSLTVKDTLQHPPVLLAAAIGAKELAASQKVDAYWYYLTAAIILISLFFTCYFAVKWNKAKKNITPPGPDAEREYQKMTASVTGQEGSRELLFMGKNYLPLPEKEVSDVARMMRMRINDETPFIDISKTIGTAVENAGFFQPVYSNRTRQCEYLVLIDDISASSQQVKLFEYLLDLLVKQGVFIDRFYYRRSPAHCYNANVPHGIGLEKLSEKYPRHILLIMGNAYQLLYDVYPGIDRMYLPLLHRWQHKAVLTPVSFADWGNKEKKALCQEMPVVPVDIPGQLLLLKKLFVEEVNLTAALHQYNHDFYEAESLDLEDIDELYDYCNNADWAKRQGAEHNNVLFQWIAALATWPKVNWEITLAVGKAILGKQGLSNELNFTSLLRIARIKWMREGRFPDYTRSLLLKKLTRENEIIARETILMLLGEIPQEVLQQDHFAFEEKEIQRLTNEFILYAFDPEKYAAYKNSKDVFGKMNAKGEVMDEVSLQYLENPGLQWQTLINAPAITGARETGKPSTLAGYFTAETGFLKKVYLWSTSVSAVIFFVALVALISLVVIGISGTSRFPYFTSADTSEKNIRFTVSLPAAGNTRSASDTFLMIQNIPVVLDGRSVYNVPVRITDSLVRVAVAVDGNALFDTLVRINKDAYVLSSPLVQPADSTVPYPGVDSAALPPDTFSAKEESPVAMDKPLVYIQVSDRSLFTSASQFKKVLEQKLHLNVSGITVAQNKYNSEITCYNAGMLSTAKDIKEYYNQYYPGMNVQVAFREAQGTENNKNLITVWIKKLESATPEPANIVYNLQNAKFPPAIRQGTDISVAFQIAAAGRMASNQAQQSGKITGTLCTNEGNVCTTFYISQFNSGSRSVVEQLNTKNLPPGKYLLNVVVKECKIQQVIGTFTVEGSRPLSPACDTVSSVISRGQGDISKSYFNPAMKKMGINLELMSLDEKKQNADFILQKEGCNQEKISLYIRKNQVITFCDGSKLTVQLKQFRKNQNVAFNNEISFDAVFCNSPALDNQNPVLQKNK